MVSLICRSQRDSFYTTFTVLEDPMEQHEVLKKHKGRVWIEFSFFLFSLSFLPCFLATTETQHMVHEEISNSLRNGENKLSTRYYCS